MFGQIEIDLTSKIMQSIFKTISAVVGLAILISSCGTNTASDESMELTEEQLIEKAKGIHERVITLDTHDDINTSNFVEDRNYTMDLDNQVHFSVPSSNEPFLQERHA